MCLASVKESLNRLFFPCIARLDDACKLHTVVSDSLRSDIRAFNSLIHPVSLKKGEPPSPTNFQKKAFHS